MLYEHDGESRISDGIEISADEALQNAIEWGMVPAVPCEHGKIDGHWSDPIYTRLRTGQWCPGAGNGDKMVVRVKEELMSRAEWEATINREAVMAAFIDAKHRNLTTVRAVHAVLVAVLGGDK